MYTPPTPEQQKGIEEADKKRTEICIQVEKEYKKKKK